jgi:hypothetical protein
VRRCALGGADAANPVHAYQSGNVLDLPFPQIRESKFELIAYLVSNDPADADPAWLGERFESSRDVDAVVDAGIRGDAGVPLGYRLLHLHRAANRVDDARKLDQHAVAGGLNDAAMVLGDFRIDELAA